MIWGPVRPVCQHIGGGHGPSGHASSPCVWPGGPNVRFMLEAAPTVVLWCPHILWPRAAHPAWPPLGPRQPLQAR